MAKYLHTYKGVVETSLFRGYIPLAYFLVRPMGYLL